MILVLEGADFSQNNLGQIEVTTILDDFTKAAIVVSGNNSLTDLQKGALNTFFKKLGAFGESGTIWNKINYLWLPMIAGDLAHSLVNYKNNVISATPDNSIWTLQDKGIKAIGTPSEGISITLPSAPNKSDLSMFGLSSAGALANYIRIGSANPGRISIRQDLASNGNLNVMIQKDAAALAYANTFASAPLVDKYYEKLYGVSIYGSSSNNGFILNKTDVMTGTVQLPSADLNTNITLLRDISKVNNSSNGSVRLIAIGTHFTSDEMVQMKEACEALQNAIL